MKTLHLHIGHGKTGTSFIQSTFARSRAALAAAGLNYPGSLRNARAYRGGTTSGNAFVMSRNLSAPVCRWLIAKLIRKGRRGALYSSEFLFAFLSRRDMRDPLLRFADAGGFDRISVLLFIRDPVEHLASAYAQNVSRAGEAAPIDQMVKRFNMPGRVLTVLKALDHPRIDVTVWNYSREKSRLLTHVSNWLEIDETALTPPVQGRVNRTLTAFELEMQRAFNARFGPSGDLFVDHVTDLTPSMKGHYIRLTGAQRDELKNKLANAMDLVNQRIPEDQAYRFDMDGPLADEGAADAPLTVDPAHLRLIVETLSKKIRR